MKKIISLILTLCLAFSAVSALALFSDIDEATSLWAGEAIDYLYENSIVNGYGDSTFRPENSVTRAEFAKMLSVSFELEKSEQSFGDIDSHWAYDYILSSAPMLFNEGDSFNPDENASREFIAYGLVTALNLKTENIDVLAEFSDNRTITIIAIDALAAAVENGILKGYEDGTIRPRADVTRAEAATLIYRAIKLKDSLAKPEIPDAPEVPEKPETPEASAEHIYGLYPGKNLLLISGVSETVDEDTNRIAYKLHYYLADGEEEFSSVIPDDVKVEGLRTSVSQIKAGDVLIMDTAFHGKISCLYAFASFGESVPDFSTYTSYKRGEDYTLEYGKVTALRTTNKYTVLTIENGGNSKDINVISEIDAYIFSPWKSNNKWSLEDLGAIDYENEDVYVFVRYTNALSTDVVISDIMR